jgi:hypothetical protein
MALPLYEGIYLLHNFYHFPDILRLSNQERLAYDPLIRVIKGTDLCK